LVTWVVGQFTDGSDRSWFTKFDTLSALPEAEQESTVGLGRTCEQVGFKPGANKWGSYGVENQRRKVMWQT